MGEIIFIISIPVLVVLFLAFLGLLNRDRRNRLRHRRGQHWLPAKGEGKAQKQKS